MVKEEKKVRKLTGGTEAPQIIRSFGRRKSKETKQLDDRGRREKNEIQQFQKKHGALDLRPSILGCMSVLQYRVRELIDSRTPETN